MSWIRRVVPTLFGSAGVAGFDPVFYGQYYRDLSTFDTKQLLEHYKKHGKREERAKNFGELKERLEAEHGELPGDFDREGYKSINKGLPNYFRYGWELDLHYIAVGREAGCRYKIKPGSPARRLIYVYRGDGVGTRLLTMIYAKILADILGFRVKVVWDKMLSPFYSDGLFDPEKVGEIFADSHIFHDVDEQDGEICAAIPQGIKMLRLEFGVGSTKMSANALLDRLEDEDYEALLYEQPWSAFSFMEHERDLHSEVRRIWTSIAWSAPISAYIEQFCAFADIGNRIAVHVRRGDLVRTLVEADPNLPSESVTGIFLRYASLESYILQIDEVRIDEKLLVCSEDNRMAEWFKGKYGDANICSSRIEDRLTEDQQSVVDIVLLSRAKILVSPYSSTFSSCAAVVGECRHVAMPIDLGPAVEELIAIVDSRTDGGSAQVKAQVYLTAARLATDDALRTTFMERAGEQIQKIGWP